MARPNPQQSKLLTPTATLWAKACSFDGIDPASKFVCFTDQNPWAKLYDGLVTQLLARKEVRA